MTDAEQARRFKIRDHLRAARLRIGEALDYLTASGLHSATTSARLAHGSIQDALRMLEAEEGEVKR
jgi:hypothetical protein